ncbi:MAG: lysophospholipid acyltransferase family protein [Candidatus Omnitrophica bacterium]|nr:lysophospholipid acyltransferase family protein [Candidatus Omnitrophota bacterium]
MSDRIKYSKRFQRAVARYSLFSFAAVFVRAPYWFVRGVGRFFIVLAFRLTVRQHKVARESLQIAFGEEKSPQDIEKIIHKCFENVGWGMVEMVYAMAHPKFADTHVRIEGKEILDEALAGGNGVVAVTAHFGNFPLMMFYLGRQGYPVSSIVRPTRDLKVEAYLHRKRTEVGLKTIYAVPRNECVRDSLKALRENQVVFVPIDQNFGNGSGVFVKFFGQKAATATGPVVFSQRTKAPIVPFFIIREGKDTHRIIVEKPIELENGKDDQETLVINTQKITALIEQYIRRYPEEWGWMHRRWKSQPLVRKKKNPPGKKEYVPNKE